MRRNLDSIPSSITIVLVGVLASTTNARAQCGQWDPIFGTPQSQMSVAECITLWDPDGSGPTQPQLFVDGLFYFSDSTSGGNLARWDGATWQRVGGGLNGRVRALTTWDPDGSEPLPAVLVAAGEFTVAGAAPSVYSPLVAYWDGVNWHSLGTGLGPVASSPYVGKLTTWDPDGPGPQPPLLVAGGTFTNNNGAVTLNRLAFWDGANWQPFGTGADAEVRSLTSWDPDGQGPLTPRLVVGGNLSSINGTTLSRIGYYNGTAWQALASGFDSAVTALTVADPDGAGPLGAQLIAEALGGRA